MRREHTLSEKILVDHVVDLCRQHHQELYLTWPGLGLMLHLAGTTFGDMAGFRDPSLHDTGSRGCCSQPGGGGCCRKQPRRRSTPANRRPHPRSPPDKPATPMLPTRISALW